MFNSNSLLGAMISSSPQLSALFSPALSTVAPTSGGSTQLQQQLTAAALAANNLINAQYNTSNCVSPPNDFSSALLLIQAQQQLAAETAAPLFNNTSLSQPQQLNFNSFASQIAPPPSYETAIQQQNLQHHKLLSSLSTSTLMGQQTTAIQSPDIFRLTQVTIKDEEDQQQQLQGAIFANFLNNNVAEDNANAAGITNEDADNANMPIDVVSEEQLQEDEERLDEEPLDLSIRRNSKKKKALINRSHADPCTSTTATTPSTLRGSVIQNQGLMPGREVKRSASSVSYRAVEPDVQEHFRRSLSGKWPRRHNHAQVHCSSPYSAIGSSVASVSSISAQSQDSSDQLSFKLSPTEEIAPAFPTNVDALPAYYRKKSLSSSSSISAPPCTAPPPPPSAINPHAQTRRSFNGYSSAKSPAQGSSRMVTTQIIISENGVNQVEEHFRRSFQAMKEKQRKQKESLQKNAQNGNLQNSSVDGNVTNRPQQ
ncbi:hypothetical protein DdX_08084 [Ditylenchus destructor]|uniref:Uncharacterized protein n=1 Tax=Ditylenchus destructor TaxID=166010 RepID=A0AAD4N3R3_9BILA|nr:hypothetical protein DdX_08084 [Ditylenchus destructor]